MGSIWFWGNHGCQRLDANSTHVEHHCIPRRFEQDFPWRILLQNDGHFCRDFWFNDNFDFFCMLEIHACKYLTNIKCSWTYQCFTGGWCYDFDIHQSTLYHDFCRHFPRTQIDLHQKHFSFDSIRWYHFSHQATISVSWTICQCYHPNQFDPTRSCLHQTLYPEWSKA